MGTFVMASAAAPVPRVRCVNATAVAHASRAYATGTPCVASHTKHIRLVSTLLSSHRRGESHSTHPIAFASHWKHRGDASNANHARSYATNAADQGHEGTVEDTDDTVDGDYAEDTHPIEYENPDDSYDAFVANWRRELSDIVAEPNARKDAHKASCAEGRRAANEKRKKRAVRHRRV